MKNRIECIELLASSNKEQGELLGIKVRNGQTIEAIKKTLAWVLK